MILVIGATGFLGAEICRLLTEKGYAVRGMVRKQSDQGKILFLEGIGVELVYGDLRNPASFERILEGADTVIASASSIPYSYIPGNNNLEMVDRAGMINLINASKHSGVKHFLYMSLSGNINVDFPLKNAKREVEKSLQSSGIPYTILRPGYFMEVWIPNAMGYDVEHNRIHYFGDGTNPVSYISLIDVARFVVESISNPVAWNNVLEIGGPEKLSQLDVITIFEETIGHPFRRISKSVDEIKTRLYASDDVMEKSMAGLMYCLAKGDPIDMRELMKKISFKPRTVRDFAKSILAEAYSYDFY